MPLKHNFWPEDPPVLVGYALESGPSEGFLRTTIDPRLLKIAFQLRQFLPSEVDLSKWL